MLVYDMGRPSFLVEWKNQNESYEYYVIFYESQRGKYEIKICKKSLKILIRNLWVRELE